MSHRDRARPSIGVSSPNFPSPYRLLFKWKGREGKGRQKLEMIAGCLMWCFMVPTSLSLGGGKNHHCCSLSEMLEGTMDGYRSRSSWVVKDRGVWGW